MIDEASKQLALFKVEKKLLIQNCRILFFIGYALIWVDFFGETFIEILTLKPEILCN